LGLSSKNNVNKLYKACDGIPVLPRQQIVDKLVAKNIEGNSSSIIRKFLNILHKSKLAKVSQIIDDEKTIEIIKTNDYIQKIDLAMLSRLLSAINESNSKIEKDELKKLLYGNYTDKEFEKIVRAAKENVVNKDDNDH